MAGLPWKCVQGCWALPLAFLVTAALCLFSWRGQMIVLPEVNHLWQICSAHTCADTLQAGWTSTGERFCLFKNVHILQCTFPSFHTLASGHWCFVITFFPSSSSPFYSPLFFCCQRHRTYLHLPGHIKTQTGLLLVDGRWIFWGSLAWCWSCLHCPNTVFTWGGCWKCTQGR